MRWRFLIRRLAMLAGTLLVASFVIFGSLYVAPGSPLAALSGGRALPPGSLQVLEQRYHLNAPFLAQYWYWLDNALHGNLGISITLRENVSTLIASRIWTTAALVLYASVIIALAGIGLGILAGLRPGAVDTSALAGTALTAAIPSFVAAIVLILLFAVRLRWFPALGNGSGLLSDVRHLTLPAIALALSSLAIVARVTRTAIREEADREHVQTAVSRGIPARQLIRRHVLRNALMPTIAVVATQVGYLVGGLVAIEYLFNYQGIGFTVLQAAHQKDFTVLTAGVLFVGVAYLFVTLVADILFAVLNPRIRFEAAE